MSGPSGASSSTWFSPTSEQHSLDALLLDDLAVGQLELKAVAVELERLVELLDGDADVVDPGEHAPQSIAARARSPRLGAYLPPATSAALAAATTRRPTPGARSIRGVPSMIRSIAVAFEHLALEQLVRERVELAAVSDDQPLRRAPRLLDQILALLVADPQRRLRQLHVTVRRATEPGRAHREVVHHLV